MAVSKRGVMTMPCSASSLASAAHACDIFSTSSDLSQCASVGRPCIAGALSRYGAQIKSKTKMCGPMATCAHFSSGSLCFSLP
eukprot:1948453-Prymnesium_polylepis.1